MTGDVTPIRPADPGPSLVPVGAFDLRWEPRQDPITGRWLVVGRSGGAVLVRVAVTQAPHSVDPGDLAKVIAIQLGELGDGAAELMAGLHPAPGGHS